MGILFISLGFLILLGLLLLYVIVFGDIDFLDALKVMCAIVLGVGLIILACWLIAIGFNNLYK